MTNNTNFGDEDENIFSEEDISYDAPAKGNRIIPSWLMGDFMAWLDRYHPEIPMIRNLPRHKLEQFINEFEYFNGQRYDFTVEEWQYNLRFR